jgi:16S rRNA (adenine1518-N6/adenine1519-N6)-dimethyltransferase
MDLLKETKDLCKLYGIVPARSRGQNFLINETVYDKIITTTALSKKDTVLEVGPGLGWLTFLLAKKAKQVMAVELDKKLAEVLKLRLEMKEIKNVEVIQEDILNFFSRHPRESGDPDAVRKRNEIPAFAGMTKEYKIVANLPYNITSIFLRKFLESANKPKTMTLMLQREVAQRLTAQAGAMSLLGLSVQFYAEPKLIAVVDKKDFWPEPAVMSAIVHLKVKNKLPLPEKEIKLFFHLAHFGFSAKRKMLKNNLAAGLPINAGKAEKYLTQAGLPPTCRPQDLALNDWLKLFGIAKDIML